MKTREFPIKRFWYGKGASCGSIEELIDKNPGWFLWAVSAFQDVTEDQAKHFEDKYQMDLPADVICPQEALDLLNEGSPFEHTKDTPEKAYPELCDRYNQYLLEHKKEIEVF